MMPFNPQTSNWLSNLMFLPPLCAAFLGLARADLAFQHSRPIRFHSAMFLNQHTVSRHQFRPLCQNREDETSSLLRIRGGALMADQEVLTFGQNLAGTSFALIFMMFGLACGFAPEKSASFFYNDSDADGDTTKFLMRLLGAFASGIGLTTAFAIGSEIEAVGHLPAVPEIRQAMGIGVLPRIFFLTRVMFSTRIPSILRLTRTIAVLGLSESCLLAASLFTGRMYPGLFIKFEVAFGLWCGAIMFFRPRLAFMEDSNPSTHEIFFTRIVASHRIALSVMWGALWNPSVNALPSVGLTSFVFVLAIAYIHFIRRDIEECGSSISAHIGLLVGGIAVATAGLRHHLIR